MFHSVLTRLRAAQSTELEGSGAEEAGFTLIELMVVLLIIAILLAIAIPTFLGVTGSANDRAAQSNLTNALTEASAVYQANNQTYSGISAALVSSAPEFSWSASNSSVAQGSNQIGVNTVDVATASPSDAQGVELVSFSKTGTCWWVVQLNATPVPLATDTTGNQFAKTLGAGSAAAGREQGATSAGTYYAEQVKSTTANCVATYPQTDSAGFVWGNSYGSPGVNP